MHDIRLLRPVLTIIDPLVRLHAADENRVNEMTPVMEELQRLTELGTAVLLVHHVSKRSGTRQPLEARRGDLERSSRPRTAISCSPGRRAARSSSGRR